MKRKISLLWAITVCLFVSAQGFNVKEFKMNLNDGSAFQAPIDAEGHPCGLIKVRTSSQELTFEGEIIGEVENKTNEYWVFMKQGSDKLVIKHPNFLPTSINLSDYNMDEVASKATYILTLEEQKYNKEKCGLVATVKPSSARLMIDGVTADNSDGDGYYQLYLPKGEHFCRFEQDGYRPNAQAIKAGKGVVNLNVELESVMATLEINCKTSTAEIYVDGELKGNGTWKGDVAPNNYLVEARQKNYITHKQRISLSEKDSRTFILPELKRAMGKIKIVTTPSNIPVKLDGEDVGVSPCVVETETGTHGLRCNAYGCVPYRSTIEVNDGEMKTVTIKPQFEDETYEAAYDGDSEAILIKALNARFKEDEASFWINRHPKKENIIKNWKEINDLRFGTGFDWFSIHCLVGEMEKAIEEYNAVDLETHSSFDTEEEAKIGRAFLEAKEFDKALEWFNKALSYNKRSGLEGLGDYYKEKGNKQLAASYYQKYLNSLDYYSEAKERVEKKMKELGY